MTHTLQLSGNENVWLMDDGTLQIFGIKICDTEAELGQGEIVGIQYPPEFVCLLMNFLNEHYNMFFRDDIPTVDHEAEDMRDWNPDDIEDEPDEDPHSPGYDSDE